jgi:outer membrane protein assembly factor BamB
MTFIRQKLPLAYLSLLVALSVSVSGCDDGDAGEDFEDATSDLGDGSPDTDGQAIVCESSFAEATSGEAYELLDLIGEDVTGEFRSFSSPRAHDLDGDGCQDFVFGSGVERDDTDPDGEFDGMVIAIDGATGEVMWERGVAGEVVGSAQFLETASGELRVLIGGRYATFVALDANTGEVEWRADETEITSNPGILNFYTPLIVSDRNDDGTDDILTVYGGDPTRAVGESRPPGHVVLFDGESGDILAARQTPDGRESYTSPTRYRRSEDSAATSEQFVFGTGGETLAGAVFLASVSDVMDEEVTAWSTQIGESSGGKGLIAPVTIADVDGDDVRDFIINFFGGEVRAVSGADLSEIWSTSFEGEESNQTPAIAKIGEGELGVAVTHNVGVFPQYTAVNHRLLDASTGEVLEEWNESLGFASSPLAIDINDDGIDEILLGATTFGGGQTTSSYLVHDVAADSTTRFDLDFAMVSTPLAFASDADGRFELAMVGFAAASGEAFPEWSFQRRYLAGESPDEWTWGAYLGTCENGLFPCER